MARARSQFVDLLTNIAPLAQRAGVTLVIEPLNTRECNFINTLSEAAALIETCGHPSVMLLADTYHMGFNAEGPDAVRQFGNLLRHFHMAEHPSRRCPGTDGGNYRGWFEALREVDYVGGISMECSWEAMSAEIGPSLARVRRDLAAAGYARGQKSPGPAPR